MDEEEILRSSLEQSNKIDIGNFFGSPIGGLANRALLQSNTSLKSTTNNLNLIRALQTSLESLRSEIQQITNYILVDKQERSKILQQRELEEFEREDAIQKGLVRPESVQPRGLEDSLPFFPEARFSEGLTAGMSSIGERQGVAQFQERFVEGSRPFFFGGLVPGSGNSDTVNAKLTPGEFIVPKNTVEELGVNPLMDFVKGGGLVGALGRKLFGGKKEKESNKKISPEMERRLKQMRVGDNLAKKVNVKSDYFPEGEDYLENEGDGPIFYNSNDARNYLKKNNPNMLKQFSSKSEIENYVLSDKQEKIIANKLADEHASDTIPSNLINEKGEVTGSYSTYPIDDEFGVTAKDENKRGLFGGLFGGDKKNENVKSADKKGRGLFGAIGGTIDAATGNLTDFDKRGGKPFGLMRGLTGTIDAATGGLTDLDRRGGKPFGLMRGITGSIDAMTGGLTDLDRRGGKPFGTMRLATGVADAMTGNMFDLDRRGDGKQKQLRPSEDPSHPMYQKIQQLKNKTNQLPMETTVNPDGSITSEGSGTFIGGELVKPGEPLTPMQRASMTMNIQMGNTYSSEIMKKYNNSGGAPSKEEFDNYEKEKSKNIRPEEEKSKNLKPEQTLGERFMNMFKGDKKEKSSQLLSSAPSSKYSPNTSISSDDSIKAAAKGLMTPPPPPQSETIELPPQTQGSDGGGSNIAASAPSFKPSTPGYTGLTPTKSPIPFIDVISNQYLSVV